MAETGKAGAGTDPWAPRDTSPRQHSRLPDPALSRKSHTWLHKGKSRYAAEPKRLREFWAAVLRPLAGRDFGRDATKSRQHRASHV